MPNNQVNGKLDDGYCVIDGTVQSNKEPNYTSKKDVFMSLKLPHIGLNCPVPKKGLKGTRSKTKNMLKSKGIAAPKKSGNQSRGRFPF